MQLLFRRVTVLEAMEATSSANHFLGRASVFFFIDFLILFFIGFYTLLYIFIIFYYFIIGFYKLCNAS